MNLFKLTILCTTVLLFIGCASSPKAAVSGTFDALADGDSVALFENATRSTATLLAVGAMRKCKVNKKDFDNRKELVEECLKQAYGDVDIENIEVTEVSDTSAYAIVTLSRNSREDTQRMDLVKVNDTWKVNIQR